MKALLLKERQEKLQLEIQLREEICNEMVEQMQQREQWCRYHGVAFQPSPVTGTAAAGSVPQVSSSGSSLPFSDSERLDTQKELLEELYEEKLKILKESLTTFYQEQIQVQSRQPLRLLSFGG